MDDPNYYGVLGVLPTATADQIKRAFRTASKRCHPDVGGSEAKMIELLTAYEVLSDPQMRSAYDQWRAGRAPLPVVVTRPSESDWRSYVGSAEKFDAWVRGQTSGVASTWQRVCCYAALVKKAAKLEWAAFNARYAEGRANRNLADCVKEYGRLAIEQSIIVNIATADCLCRHGVQLAHRIRERRAKIESAEAELKRLDSRSAAARQTRADVDKAKRNNKDDLARLETTEAQLGSMIRTRVETWPAFASLIEPYRTAESRMQRTRATAESVRTQRKGVDHELGIPFRAAAAFIMTAVVTLGLWLLPIGGMTTTAIGWVAGQEDKSQPVTSRAAGQLSGLSRNQLALAAEVVETRWTTWRPGSKGLFGWTPLPDVNGGCRGSAGVISVSADGEMTLITNRHVLDMEAIAATKANGDLALTDYKITVKFPSGATRQVLRIGHETQGIDAATLVINGAGLREGKDYVMLPLAPPSKRPTVGDEVVAIGSPGIGGVVFENTQTFGRISRFRDWSSGNTMTRSIQTDVAINHGNSGGPLLFKSGDQFYWAGINTFVVGRDHGYQGINFAIVADQAADARYNASEATAWGTAIAMTKWYGCSIGATQK